MALRCGCPAEGDATVFGELHECSKDPDLRYQTSPGIWYQRPYEHVLSDDCEPGDLG